MKHHSTPHAKVLPILQQDMLLCIIWVVNQPQQARPTKMQSTEECLWLGMKTYKPHDIQVKAANITRDFKYFHHEVNIKFMAGSEINNSVTKYTLWSISKLSCLLNSFMGYSETVKGGNIQPSRRSTQMKLACVWESTPTNIHLPGLQAAKDWVMVTYDNINGD